MDEARTPIRNPLLVALVALALLCARDGAADDPAAVPARTGLAIAAEAAHAWAPDAALVWVENDEAPVAPGASARWGYLFYSAASEKARAYSVKDGRIVTAENLDLAFDAPPLASDWIDSGAAYAAAEESRARASGTKTAPRGTLEHLLLTRGTMDATNPDRTTWTLVYAMPNQPSLFVVVDATSGKVLRTWKG